MRVSFPGGRESAVRTAGRTSRCRARHASHENHITGTNTLAAPIFHRLCRRSAGKWRLLVGLCPLCHRWPAVGAAARRIMPEASNLLRGKRGLILGVANNRSIAWGIAQGCHAQGAELAVASQGDASRKTGEPLADEVGGTVGG